MDVLNLPWKSEFKLLLSDCFLFIGRFVLLLDLKRLTWAANVSPGGPSPSVLPSKWRVLLKPRGAQSQLWGAPAQLTAALQQQRAAALSDLNPRRIFVLNFSWVANSGSYRTYRRVFYLQCVPEIPVQKVSWIFSDFKVSWTLWLFWGGTLWAILYFLVASMFRIVFAGFCKFRPTA